MGWLGRPGARDMREPDAERICVCGAADWRLCTEFERFIAEAGIGIAELPLMPPSVCALSVCLLPVEVPAMFTSRERRTEKRCASCAIVP